jgi:hypothetical protein
LKLTDIPAFFSNFHRTRWRELSTFFGEPGLSTLETQGWAYVTPAAFSRLSAASVASSAGKKLSIIGNGL